MKIAFPHLVIAFLIVLCPTLAPAQELTLQYGTTRVRNEEGHDKSWQIDFRYRFLQNFAVSTSYLNEGHVPGHKRDGLATQLWGGIPLFRRAVSVDFGAGVYRFSDTQPRPGGSYADVEGWAGIYSGSATYYLRSPWYFRLTANTVRPGKDASTNTYGLGVGYRLWKGDGQSCPLPSETPCKSSSRTTGDEVTAFVGQSVVNSIQDQKGVAAGLEIRKGIYDHLDGSISWLYEGDKDVIRRNGVAGELWLVDGYLDRRLTLGIGGGAYAFVDKRNPNSQRGGNPGDLGGILSLTTGWRIADHWVTRFNWHRVVSGNNRDTDIFMAGAGYRWEE